MKFNSKTTTLFIDPNSLSHYDSHKGEKVNIILSPSLYWVKKLSLPVKNVRDALKLVPSLFEDTLPKGNYSYSAYKSGDKFFIFAYEDRHILDVLSHSGISPSTVANVYFSQSEMQNIEGALRVNETQSIYVKDDIVVLVPSRWLEGSSKIDIDSIALSKHHVSLKQFGHIVNNKSLYIIITIFSLLIILIATEYFITSNKIAATTLLKDELFEKKGLKSTMIQNRSILKKYKTLHSTQTKFREYTSYILSLRLKKEQKLSLLSLSKKKLIAEFNGINKGDEKDIKRVFKSKNLLYKSTFKDDTWRVEIEL